MGVLRHSLGTLGIFLLVFMTGAFGHYCKGSCIYGAPPKKKYSISTHNLAAHGQIDLGTEYFWLYHM